MFDLLAAAIITLSSPAPAPVGVDVDADEVGHDNESRHHPGGRTRNGIARRWATGSAAVGIAQGVPAGDYTSDNELGGLFVSE